MQYPDGILKLDYDPNFAIRGLHYDIEKGFLMKLDSFLQIELRSVYKGLTKVPETDVLKLYKSRKVPYRFVDTSPLSKVRILKFLFPLLYSYYTNLLIIFICDLAKFSKNDSVSRFIFSARNELIV